MMELSTRTLGDWLEHWALTTPDKEYIVYSDRNLRFTWKQFNERVDHMAKGLLAIGVKRGTHVGIWAGNVPDWLTFLYACAKIGAVAVTVNTNYKQAELEYLCQNSDMHTLCIVNGDRGNDDYVNMVYAMLPELKTSQRGYLKSKRFPCMKNVIYIGPEKYRGMYNTAEILLLGCNIDDDELLEAKAKVNCHDTVNMQYTSGTTGFPKGVMLTHYNISNNGFLTGEHMKFTSDDKLCVCVPLFHCFGVVLATMNCLTHGCTQVMVERFDPLLVLASVHKERCTALYGVPTMFIAELNHPMFDMFDMSSLRTGIMAGSLCPVELMKRVEEKMFMKVTSVYGLTEASPGMTASRIDDSFDVRCNTVGRDFEFTEVKVIDPETGEECPIGVQGEMCNKGYNTMKGYYKNPEAGQAGGGLVPAVGIQQLVELCDALVQGGGIVDLQQLVLPHQFQRLADAFPAPAAPAAQLLQQDGPPGGVLHVRPRLQLPAALLLPQPAGGVWMALHPSGDVQHDLGQTAVVPPGGQGVHQPGEGPLGVHALIPAVQGLLQHPGHQHLGLPLVAQAEVRVQVQQVAALPQQGGAEGVDGGDLGLVDQGGLPPQVPVVGPLRQPVGQLLGDTGPQLRRRRLGVGDDQELVDVQPLALHPVQQPLHQHPGLARPGGGGNQELSPPVPDDFLLFLCQGKGHVSRSFPGVLGYPRNTVRKFSICRPRFLSWLSFCWKISCSSTSMARRTAP